MKTGTGFREWFCLGLVSLYPAAAGSDTTSTVARSQVRDARSRVALERAFAGAVRKLTDPQCAKVFSDFTDPSGQPLQQKLDTLGVTAAGYLQLVVFADGRVPGCADPENLAVTSPGSRVVFLCPRFARLKSDGYKETILIHEALHSLGLRENPPSSAEITERVEARCPR
jgi:hypothetical protein